MAHLLKSSAFLFLFAVLVNTVQAQECTKQETICSTNCTQRLACLRQGATPIFIENCKAPQICLNGVCQAGTCDGTADKEVRCLYKGQTPDPTNCRATRWCDTDNGEALTVKTCKCPDGYYVDLSRPSLSCKQGSKCPQKEITCKNFGQGGKLQDNTDFCYTCISENPTVATSKLYPAVFVCESTQTNVLKPDLFASIDKVCTPP